MLGDDIAFKRYSKSRETVDLDSFDVDAIRRTVHEFYDKKEYPTLNRLLQVLKEKEIFVGKCYCLWKLLKKIGFCYRSVNDKQYVYEQQKIIIQRHKFLRRMCVNRREQRPVVYLDETWANPHDGRERTWVEKDERTGGTKGGMHKPSGKGSRLIILRTCRRRRRMDQGSRIGV